MSGFATEPKQSDNAFASTKESGNFGSGNNASGHQVSDHDALSKTKEALKKFEEIAPYLLEYYTNGEKLWEAVCAKHGVTDIYLIKKTYYESIHNGSTLINSTIKDQQDRLNGRFRMMINLFTKNVMYIRLGLPIPENTINAITAIKTEQDAIRECNKVNAFPVLYKHAISRICKMFSELENGGDRDNPLSPYGHYPSDLASLKRIKVANETLAVVEGELSDSGPSDHSKSANQPVSASASKEQADKRDAIIDTPKKESGFFGSIMDWVGHKYSDYKAHRAISNVLSEFEEIAPYLLEYYTEGVEKFWFTVCANKGITDINLIKKTCHDSIHNGSALINDKIKTKQERLNSRFAGMMSGVTRKGHPYGTIDNVINIRLGIQLPEATINTITTNKTEQDAIRKCDTVAAFPVLRNHAISRMCKMFSELEGGGDRTNPLSYGHYPSDLASLKRIKVANETLAVVDGMLSAAGPSNDTKSQDKPAPAHEAAPTARPTDYIVRN